MNSFHILVSLPRGEEEGTPEKEKVSATSTSASPPVPSTVASLGRSSSALDLRTCMRRTMDVFRRKRIVREASTIGRGMARTLSCGSLPPAWTATDGASTRKKIAFLSSQGVVRKESVDIPSVQSMPLKKKHWLEAVDTKHRYGSNLSRYYEIWKETSSRENFFVWLDHGPGRELDLPDCPREVLDKEVIKYLTTQEREKYEVVVKDGIMAYKETGSPVHTMDREPPSSYGQEAGEGSRPGEPDDMKQNDTWIFVCSPEGKIYVGKKRLNPSPRFQHSSFLAGGAALAAGQMDVHRGKVIEVRAFSGHYRPKRENLLAFLQMLNDNGVDTRQVRFRQFKSK
ncbi:IQ domain-containing protein IQM5 [Chloropicon primus]|nr:IQ domain-containing protein IQM5 [Chloropicon primus]